MFFAHEVGARLGVFGHALDVAFDDELGHFRSEKSFAGADCVDRGDEIAHRIAFQDVAEGAGVEHLANHFGRVMHGKNKNLSAAAAIGKLSRGLQSIKARHADIQQRDIGIKQTYSLDGFLAVTRFAYDRPAKLRLQQIAQPKANNFMVVCQE